MTKREKTINHARRARRPREARARTPVDGKSEGPGASASQATCAGTARGQGRSARGAIAACLAGSALLAPACAEGGGAAEAPLAEVGLAIEGGEESSEETEVVQLEWPSNGSLLKCSGVIVGANLVLTARHCVEQWFDDPDACGGGGFVSPSAGDVNVWLWGFDGEAVKVVAGRDGVRVPGPGDTICGSDVALLLVPQLAAFRNEPWFRAASPRLDRPVGPGEPYSAVGFGKEDQNSERGDGVRRRRSGLAVACSGDSCGGANVRAGEWRGEAGVCSGDSGGPALDDRRRVVGIASRGAADGCDDPLYTSVYAWREWLRDEALAASRQGAFRAPPWTQRVAEAGAGDGGSDGCAVTPGRAAPGAGPVAAFGAAAIAWLRARRRRRGSYVVGHARTDGCNHGARAGVPFAQRSAPAGSAQ